jgi:HSP20 family protein
MTRDTSLAPFRPSTLTTDPFFRAVDSLFGEDFFRPLRALTERRGEQGWLPPVDIRETEEAYLVTAELPGLTKKDVDVTVENSILTLSGERRWEKSSESETYHRMERAFGRFSRSFTLPHQVEADKVKANFKDGLLTVSIPKAEQAKPRRIAIT